MIFSSDEKIISPFVNWKEARSSFFYHLQKRRNRLTRWLRLLPRSLLFASIQKTGQNMLHNAPARKADAMQAMLAAMYMRSAQTPVCICISLARNCAANSEALVCQGVARRQSETHKANRFRHKKQHSAGKQPLCAHLPIQRGVHCAECAALYPKKPYDTRRAKAGKRKQQQQRKAQKRLKTSKRKTLAKTRWSIGRAKVRPRNMK